MQSIKSREQFDLAIRALVGLEVAEVTYFEIEYETPERCYLHQPDIGHFLDFGVEFRMSCGSHRSFLWDGTFHQYGIGLFPHPANREVCTNRQWVVSETPEWGPLIGSPIVLAKAYWSGAHHDNPNERTYYPQDVQLDFACGKRIYLSASQ